MGIVIAIRESPYIGRNELLGPGEAREFFAIQRLSDNAACPVTADNVIAEDPLRLIFALFDLRPRLVPILIYSNHPMGEMDRDLGLFLHVFHQEIRQPMHRKQTKPVWVLILRQAIQTSQKFPFDISPRHVSYIKCLFANVVQNTRSLQYPIVIASLVSLRLGLFKASWIDHGSYCTAGGPYATPRGRWSTWSRDSSTSTLTPRWARSKANVRPVGPAPTMITFSIDLAIWRRCMRCLLLLLLWVQICLVEVVFISAVKILVNTARGIP